ncbi:MAG TPA: hypothetical protein DCE44_03500, partial [Verrucomicrobiales bacterium]|nr:hypothetical protein [Verrucomicrobiales bacterium]
MTRAAPVSSPEIAPTSLLGHYAEPSGGFDELRDDRGKVRPHYATLIQHLEDLGRNELKRRADSARRLVQEQGITYTVYGDPLGVERPWQLDPVPLILSLADWRGLEAALIQRATLLDRILADCYGPQELIRSGWLPPALVFAQPDFIRPAHG